MRAMKLIWVVLAILSIFAIVIGLSSAPIAFKAFTTDEVLSLLGAYAVLALILERTLEALIGAWQGQQIEKLFSAAESVRRRLSVTPSNIALQEAAATASTQVLDQRAQTKRIALRAALVGGLLVAAVGPSTLGVFFASPEQGTMPALLYRILDLIITAGLVGGGSDAIHKLMSTVTTYLDVLKGGNRARMAQAVPNIVTPTIPAVSPGPPR